jgi:signal transduction histidine kinase
MKRISLLWKMAAAFLLVAITSAALVAIFIRLTNADRLSRLIIDQQRADMETLLGQYYQKNGNWDGVAQEWGMLLRSKAAQDPKDFNGGPPIGDGHDRRSFLGLADPQGLVIISVDPNYPNGSTLPDSELKVGSPLVVDGQTVGVLLTASGNPALNPAEDLFLRRTNEALLLAGLAALAVALVIGVMLALTLIRPLRALTSAAHKIAAGQLEQQVAVGSSDEIGELAGAFNRMSQQVAGANRMRKQMTADIAHDLRTPLTVIAGYIESMRDGVLQPTPERLAIIYHEIEGLQNLVTDLRMLSQMDAGELPLNRQFVEAAELLQHAAAPFHHLAEKAGVALVVQAEDGLPFLQLDDGRMMQVYGNLISNALRYTPAGGTIRLEARRAEEGVLLAVCDNGAGIDADELPHIFDRFRRADKSRHAEAGESGLGLAIVKALVEAQGGTIRARSEPGAGTTIEMIFQPAAS